MYCGPTDGWIKITLGKEVGLGPRHIVLDRDPALPPPKDTAPNFRLMSVVPNSWMDQDATRNVSECLYSLYGWFNVVFIQNYAVEIQTSDKAELALDYVSEAVQKAGGASYGTGVRE